MCVPRHYSLTQITDRLSTGLQCLTAAREASDEPPDADDGPPPDSRPLSIGYTDLRGEYEAQLLLRSQGGDASWRERLFVREPEGRSDLQEQSVGGTDEWGRADF